jgi:hypothetical protein
MKDEQAKIYGLRAQVAAYFERQAERLLGESRAAASLTTHRGLYGLAGEEAFRSFLKSHLPSKYGVGTGHVVSYNENSAQVDTVIFDTQECFTIPITETSTLFSIEGVYAVIEIKSSPHRNPSLGKVIREAITNIESVLKIVHPFPFSMVSEIPAFTSLSEGILLQKQGDFFVKLMYPVSAILLLGAGVKFAKIVEHFRKAEDSIEHWHNRPNMLCVIDEQKYGLCGFDFAIENDQVVPKFWIEQCDSPGQTLATFLYWLVHKMSFERIIERPAFYNQNVQAVWPSVMAPVVRRIKVDVDETGGQRSWPWPHETREFKP